MTLQQPIQSSFAKSLIPVIMAVLLAACGGGGGGGTEAGSSTTSSSTVPPAGSVSASSATISWTAPVVRADQTPLSLADIGGYRVYYGASADNYTNSVDVTDGAAVQVTVTNLPSGTYYFVVTAYDVKGRESTYSPVVIKII